MPQPDAIRMNAWKWKPGDTEFDLDLEVVQTLPIPAANLQLKTMSLLQNAKLRL
jgi:hypothetical protein